MRYISTMINSKTRILADYTRMVADTSKNKSAFIRIRFAYICIILIITFLSSCAAHRTHFMQSLDLKSLKDGTYIGRDAIPLCRVKLATTIKDSKITEIKILSHFVTYPLAGRAYAQIPERIIKAQSLDVDAVTAATVSTNNIKRAVFDALKKAEK